MKNIGIINYYESLNNDNVLFTNNSNSIMSDYFELMISIRNQFSLENINLEIFNVDRISIYDLVIFVDYPQSTKILNMLVQLKIKVYLIVWESIVVNENNFNLRKLNTFNKVFTYYDDLIDNKNIFKFSYSVNLPSQLSINNKDRMNKLVFIAGNKFSNHKNSLYSYRSQLIDWFIKNEPTLLDLYGPGWEFNLLKNKYIRRTLKFLKLSKIFVNKFITKVYKGKADNKITILKNYKFSLVIENAKNVNGYITEKIFHAFMAGTIPFYLGAPNVDSFIDANCYINLKDFNNFSEVADFIRKMDDNSYNQYFVNINSFLKSSKSNLFRHNYFSKVLLDYVKMDLL